MLTCFSITKQRLKMLGVRFATWQTVNQNSSPFRTQVCPIWRALSQYIIKTKRAAERCSITPSHHGFGAFLESVQVTTEATQGPRNHVGAAMIANWNRFEGILKERNEFDHTVIADFFYRSKRKSPSQRIPRWFSFISSWGASLVIRYVHTSKDYKRIREMNTIICR